MTDCSTTKHCSDPGCGLAHDGDGATDLSTAPLPARDVQRGPRWTATAQRVRRMTDDELRKALDTMMASAACPHCDALFELVVRHYDDGLVVAYPRVSHDDGCPEAAA